MDLFFGIGKLIIFSLINLLHVIFRRFTLLLAGHSHLGQVIHVSLLLVAFVSS
jgi:hypothetical protein